MNQIPDYNEYKLPNGLFVALKATTTQTIYGKLVVHHGALDEHEGEEGLAHFLEHAIIGGGSLNYTPEESLNTRDIFTYKADKKTGFNSYTLLSKTVFPIDLLKDDLESYLDLISDMVFNPGFDSAKVEEERPIVLKECTDEKKDPAFNEKRAFANVMFKEGSPYLYPISGKEEVITKATIDDLKRFYNRGYNAGNMDLIIAGALPENIEGLIEAKFGDKPAGKRRHFEFPGNHPLDKAAIIYTPAIERYNSKNPQASMAHLGIGLAAPPDTKEDSCATRILTRIFGSDTTSRLTKYVSDELDLACSIASRYDGSDKKGVIQIGANVRAITIQESISAIFKVMNDLQEKLVSADEFNRCKRNAIYALAKGFEKNRGHVYAIEKKLYEGVIMEDYLAKMSAVTPGQVREAANKYFAKNREDEKYVLMLRDPLLC